MEKAESLSFPMIPGSGGHRQSLQWRNIRFHAYVEIVVSLISEVLGKKIASSKFCPTSESPAYRLG
jgi:hypothetical protein